MSADAKDTPVADDGFDWASSQPLIHEQAAIAVYEVGDTVVIRQRGDWNDDADHVVTVARDNLQALIDALCDIAGIGGAAP